MCNIFSTLSSDNCQSLKSPFIMVSLLPDILYFSSINSEGHKNDWSDTATTCILLLTSLLTYLGLVAEAKFITG